MKAKFYLGAYGEASKIRALYDDLKLSGSEIKPLKRKIPHGKSENTVQWMWRTEYQECTSEFPEDELTSYLKNHSELLNKLNTYRDSIQELKAIIVCNVQKGERPYGYSISRELRKILAAVDASLEIDIENTIAGNET